MAVAVAVVWSAGTPEIECPRMTLAWSCRMLFAFRVSMLSNVPMVVPTDASAEIRWKRFGIVCRLLERVDAELPERDQRGLLDRGPDRLDAHVRAAEEQEVPLMFRVVGQLRPDGLDAVPEARASSSIEGRREKRPDEPKARCDRPEVNADSRHVRP